jgi:transcription elongation factor Elf1
MQGLLYAIGNRYVKNIQRMGYENIEKLLLINFDSDKEYDNITQEEYRVYSSFMSCAQGKIANILYVFGNTLISTDAKAFERLFAYFSAQDKECEKAKEDLIVSHISLAKAVNAGIQSSFAYAHKSQISDMDSFIDSYARLIASYKEMTTTLKNQSQNNGEEENEEDEEEFDYQEYYAAVYARLAAFTQDVASLSQTKTLQGLSPQQKEELYLKALNMWNLFSDAGDLFEDAFAAANVNFFLRVIDLNGFLKRNRRALQDLIRDSIAGLIGWDIKDLEDLYDGNY